MMATRSIAASFAVLLLSLAGCAPGPPEPATASTVPGDARPYVVALGTVQDGGLPHAACRCPRCVAARDDPNRRRSVAGLAVVLPASERIFLIDATPDIRGQLDFVRDLVDTPADGMDRSPVDGVLLTHAHLGHYTGLAFFGFEAVHTRGLPVYCSESMAAFLGSNGPWDQLVRMENIELRVVDPGTPFEIGDGVSAIPIAVPHRDEFTNTLGFELRGPQRSLLYVPDTDGWNTWDPTIEQRAERVDVALLDGSFYSAAELPGRDLSAIGHPLIVDSMQRLASQAVETRILFTHLNHSNPALDPDGPQREEIERQGFAVLAEGQRFPL